MNRRTQKEETKNKIFETAINLFNEQDISNITVTDITNKIGVSKATFFNYYKTKEDIFNEIAIRDITFFENDLQKNISDIENIPLHISNGLINIAKKLHKTKRLTRNLLYLSVNSKTYEEQLKTTFQMIRNYLIPIIEKCQENNVIRSDVQASQIADNFLEIYLGSLFYWTLISDENTDIEDYLKRTYNNYLNGILI